MRCLTLADDLRQKGAEINFVCREEPGNLINHIGSKRYKVYRLPAGIDLNEEKRCTKTILSEYETKPDWLIIDHYDIDVSYESSLRKYVKKIMVIDDLANRRHDCDLLLDQNLCENMKTRYEGLVPEHCQKLLGPKYALLRSEFREARKNLRQRNGNVKRILIFFGGSDPTNETSKALEAMRLLNRPDIAVDVVIGAANPHKEQIGLICSAMSNITFHCQVDNIAQLMANADLAIGAGGTTTWERCYLGLPTIVIILAENQSDIAKYLEKVGIAINLGWCNEVVELDIKNKLEKLINETKKREIMSIKAREIFNDNRCIKSLVIKNIFG